jgi:hypothetical protein
MPSESQPGSKRKPLLYRDQCLALDVITLARAGLLEPRLHGGTVELLSGDPSFDDDYGAFPMRIRAFMGPNGGHLCVDRPREERIPVVAVDTPIGKRWRLVCKSCSSPGHATPVKRLYVPETPRGDPPPPWACRSCWMIGYRRRGRRGRLESSRKHLAGALKLRADLDNLIRIIQSGIMEEVRLSGRDPVSAGPLGAR